MPYIGNNHIAGDHTNNFKVLDDISSYTATFDGSATSVVDTTNNTIRVVEHRFIQGQRVTYTNGGGGNIGGLTTGTAYFIIHDSASTFKLATSASNAANSTAINLSAVGSGTSHTLNAAFDGVNTKFKITYNSGTGARFNNATQLNIAINNVLQKPNVNSSTFTEGFAIEDNHKIVFKIAPTNQDIFWGSIIANTLTTFDISDHKIDTFTGDGSTTEFTLSHTPANNESLMVTINGVLQHPSNASTARAYTLIASIIQFTAAPGVGDEIQVRHMGFAGATTADVSGFYGRTGNVVLTSNDHITTGNINAGIVTATSFDGTFSSNIGGSNANFTGIVTAGTFKGGNIDAVDGAFSGNVTIGGTLTYEDVTNIDSVGIITARNGIDCNGDLDVDGHTNLDNVSIAGVTTSQTINFATNARAHFASNNRLSIHSNGTNSYLDYAGALAVRSSGGSSSAISLASNGNVNIVKDLDVDGHTNLDNVSIAGFTTTSEGMTIGGNFTINSTYPSIVINDTNHDSDYRITNDDGKLIFYDTTNSATRLHIAATGSIGIGTVSPSALLHLHKASGDVTQKIESSNGAAALELRHTNGYGYIRYLQDGAETFRVGQIAQFTSYSVYNPNSSLPYQLCVEGNGEVGINTHNPANTLHLLRNTNHGITLQKGGTNPGSALIQVSSFGALKLEAANNLVLQSGGSQQIFFNRGGTTIAKFDTSSRFGINETSNINGRLHVQHDALGENILYATRYNDQSNDKPILAVTEALMTGMTASGLVIGNHNRGIHIGPVFDDSAAVQTAYKTGIRIAYTGNVGINSAMPAQKLDVDGIIRGSSYFQGGSSSTASNNYHFGAEGNGEFRIYSGNYGAGNEKLRIHSNGDVSIQTNDVRFSGAGTLRINSGSTAGALNLDGGATNHGGEINLTGGSNGGRIQFRTGQGSGQQDEKMRLDENGRLYLGSNFTGGNGDVDDLVISGTGAKGITLCSTSGGITRITFADGLSSTAAVIGSIAYEHSVDAMDFYTNALRMMRVDRANSTERLQIGAINNNSAGTRLVLGSGNNIAATAVINTQDANINALTLSNWDGSATTNKVNMHFDCSGIAGFDVGIPAATTAFKIANTSGGGGYLNIKSTGETKIYRSGVMYADINNSVQGHQFISQSNDNEDGFQVYNQHGSTATRYTFACYDNRSGSKGRSFGVRGDGKSIFYGDVLPSADTTHDLGSGSFTWDKFYYKNAYPEQSTEYRITSGSYSNGQWHDTAFGRDSMGGLDLNGVYIVTAYADLYTAMGGNYGCNYTWIVGIRNQYTNQTLVNTCPLLSVTGHSTNNFGASGATVGDGIRLGTSRTPASSGGEEQIVWRPAASTSAINNTAGRTLVFRCQRIGRSSLG